MNTADKKMPFHVTSQILNAIATSEGAWTDTAHPELRDEDHITSFVRNLRRKSEERLKENS